MDLLKENSNRLSKKWDKGKGEGRLEGIFNQKDSGEKINDEAKTSEEGYKGGVDGETYPVRDRRECR